MGQLLTVIGPVGSGKVCNGNVVLYLLFETPSCLCTGYIYIAFSFLLVFSA